MSTRSSAIRGRGGRPDPHHDVMDAEPEPHQWELIANTDDFKTLVRERGRVTVTLAVLGLGWFTLFILLSAVAQDFMATEIADGLTVAFVLGVSQILVLWAIIWTYNNRSNTRFMGLQERAAQAEAGRRADVDRASAARRTDVGPARVEEER